MKEVFAEQAIERKEQLEDKDLDGEIKDQHVDYKEEALKTFIDLIEGKTVIEASTAQSA